MTGWGVSLYIGPGYVFHWSTEDGWQRERADHRTWRLGLLFAARREQPPEVQVRFEFSDSARRRIMEADESIRRAASRHTVADLSRSMAAAQKIGMTVEEARRKMVPRGPTMMCPTPESAQKPEPRHDAPSGWSQYDWDVYDGNIRDPLG